MNDLRTRYHTRKAPMSVAALWHQGNLAPRAPPSKQNGIVENVQK